MCCGDTAQKEIYQRGRVSQKIICEQIKMINMETDRILDDSNSQVSDLMVLFYEFSSVSFIIYEVIGCCKVSANGCTFVLFSINKNFNCFVCKVTLSNGRVRYNQE